MSNGSESLLGIKRGKQWKTVKNIRKVWICPSKSLVFKSNSLESRANHSGHSVYRATRAICSWLLFCNERPERITHSCSFVKGDESNLLSFLRATKANRSLSLNYMSNFERKSEFPTLRISNRSSSHVGQMMLQTFVIYLWLIGELKIDCLHTP